MNTPTTTEQLPHSSTDFARRPERDIRDYQCDLLNVLHTHGTPEDWCYANSRIEHILDALSAHNPALEAAYREAFLVRGLPAVPTRKSA